MTNMNAFVSDNIHVVEGLKTTCLWAHFFSFLFFCGYTRLVRSSSALLCINQYFTLCDSLTVTDVTVCDELRRDQD